MKASIRVLCMAVLLSSVNSTARAQQDASVGQTEMQKWIATTVAQWQAVFKRDVTDVHVADLNKVKLQYLTALEDAIKKASSANDLKGALALRNEQKRFGETEVLSEKEDEGDTPAVKAIRTAIRAQFVKVEKDHAIRAKALHAKFDQVLAQAQTQLTQRQRLDDALLVQTKRDEVATAWLAGVPAAAEPEAVVEQPKPPAKTTDKPLVPVKPPAGQKAEKMEAKAVVAKLLEMGCEVSGLLDGKNLKVTSMDQITGKKFAVERVEFRKKAWTEQDFAILDQLDGIHELLIQETDATDAMLERARACRKLTFFGLADLPNVTGKGIQVMTRMPDLKSVLLARLPIDDASFKSALQKSKVERVELTKIGITDGSLIAMGEMQALQSAHLNTLPGLTAAGWLGFSKAKKLRTLILQNVDPGADGLTHLARCRTLETLIFSDRAPTDDELPVIRTMKQLQTFKLNNTKSPDSFIASVKAALPKVNFEVDGKRQ